MNLLTWRLKRLDAGELDNDTPICAATSFDSLRHVLKERCAQRGASHQFPNQSAHQAVRPLQHRTRAPWHGVVALGRDTAEYVVALSTGRATPRASPLRRPTGGVYLTRAQLAAWALLDTAGQLRTVWLPGAGYPTPQGWLRSPGAGRCATPPAAWPTPRQRVSRSPWATRAGSGCKKPGPPVRASTTGRCGSCRGPPPAPTPVPPSHARLGHSSPARARCALAGTRPVPRPERDHRPPARTAQRLGLPGARQLPPRARALRRPMASILNCSFDIALASLPAGNKTNAPSMLLRCVASPKAATT